MNNKKLKEILIAMMYGAGLMPDIDEDIWIEYMPSNLSRFLRGLNNYFKLPNSSFLLAHHNLDEFDTPGEALDFLLRNKSSLLERYLGEEK